MSLRNNDDLDAAFADAPSVNGTKLPPAKRRRKAGDRRDQLRRRAFRLLAQIADLNARDRAAVLKTAERLNRS